jgi:hypothetical protein
MPTAMHWYNMAAQKFCNIDPTDEKAVEDFFVKGLATLDKPTQQKVMKFLLGHDGPAKIPADCPCSSCEKTRARGR